MKRDTSEDQKKVIIFLFACALLLLIILVDTPSEAQMTIEYPRRFNFSGLIDLEYIDYSSTYSSGHRQSTGHLSFFQQSYQLNLEGYIYHPRLAVFYSSISFIDEKALSGASGKSRNLSYYLNVTFLPYRPISLNVYADRQNTNDEFNAFTEERTINTYGARLSIDLKKSTTLRSIQLEYDHSDSTSNSAEKISSNSYSLALSGNLKTIRTSYGISLGYNDVTSASQDLNLKMKYFNLSTLSSLFKGIALSTGLSYYKDNNSTQLGFSSSLAFPVGERFNHYYFYQYEKYDALRPGSTETGLLTRRIVNKYQLLQGNWSYRFTHRLSSSVSIQYGTRSDELGSWDTDSLSANLTYRRHIMGLSSTSQYRFALRDNGVRGNSREHDASIELTTRRFRWGTLYFGYYFLYLSGKNNILDVTDIYSPQFVESTIKTNSQSLMIGDRGIGIGRILPTLLWDIEATYSISSASGKRPMPTYEYDFFNFFGPQNIEFEKKNKLYSLLARINYRFGRASTYTAQAKYSIGATDSLTQRSFILEQQLYYVMRRNLSFMGRWREMRYRVEETPNTTARDFEFEVRYGVGKTYLTLNYLFIMNNSGKADSRHQRIMLKIRRVL